MIKLTQEWGHETVDLYGHLGRLLLKRPDELNARIAFWHEVWLVDNVKMFANITCDGCRLPISCAMRRFVCKTCKDGDVCGACFQQHEEGSQIVSTCIGHSFLEVASVFLPYSYANSTIGKAERQFWLQDLWMKYVDSVD
jgi:hypothetical protein